MVESHASCTRKCRRHNMCNGTTESATAASATSSVAPPSIATTTAAAAVTIPTPTIHRHKSSTLPANMPSSVQFGPSTTTTNTCNQHHDQQTPPSSCMLNHGRSVLHGSTSALNDRRRRHKTVHFGENLLLQVCRNANLTRRCRTYGKMEPNVQQLFSFIETVLSAWVAEEGLTSQGEVSEPDERELMKKRYRKHCERAKRLDIRRLVLDVSKLDGTRFLGNLRYRHFHWKGKQPDADGCNELFLRKVDTLETNNG